ncbi:MAG: hypothetical protein V7707_12750 [Motiliproteus sp.]
MSEYKMDERLAWYANGSLDDAERREVEVWLENNPEAQQQLAEYEFMQQSVGEVGAEEPVFNAQAGFDKLMARIEIEEVANETVERQAPASLLERLQNWCAETLKWDLTPAFARVAMVSQLGLVVALSAVMLLPGETDEGYQVLSGSTPTAVTAGTQATIGLNPEISLAELQALLRAQSAVIVDGPSAIGTYRIQLPQDDQLEARLAALQVHPSVLYLQRTEP